MISIYHLEKNGVPFYIGYTAHPTQRKCEHKKTYGKDTNLCVIDYDEDYIQAERYWITQYKAWGFDLLNKNEGGGGFLGKRTDKDIKNYHKEHQSNNIEKYSIATKKWQAKNKEKLAEYDKEYHLKNKAKRNAYAREYSRLLRLKNKSL